MPAGFQLLQDLPIRPWTADDTVAIISWRSRTSPSRPGTGWATAGLARLLARRYGVRRAVVDPGRPPVHPRPAGAGDRTVPPARALHLRRAPVRLHPTTPAPTRRACIPRGPARCVRRPPGDAHRASDAVKQAIDTLGLPTFGSNAWALSPCRTTTGGALLWGAPQVGYYAPEILDELEVEGGRFHVHGVSVPGGGPGVVIGYTPHTAWSITTSQDDQVATYVDRIRRHGRATSTGGAAVARPSTSAP